MPLNNNVFRNYYEIQGWSPLKHRKTEKIALPLIVPWRSKIIIITSVRGIIENICIINTCCHFSLLHGFVVCVYWILLFLICIILNTYNNYSTMLKVLIYYLFYTSLTRDVVIFSQFISISESGCYLVKRKPFILLQWAQTFIYHVNSVVNDVLVKSRDCTEHIYYYNINSLRYINLYGFYLMRLM